LFNANSAIFQLYHGENKLIFNKMRTDNTMAKRKRTNNDLQNIHIKLKIE